MPPHKFKRRLNESPIVAIWQLLATGDPYFRAAGILLLEAYTSALVSNGKGEYASRLVQAFRDADPQKGLRPPGKENRLVP